MPYLGDEAESLLSVVKELVSGIKDESRIMWFKPVESADHGSTSTLNLNVNNETPASAAIEQIKAIFPDLSDDLLNRCLRDYSPERVMEMLLEDSLPAYLKEEPKQQKQT